MSSLYQLESELREYLEKEPNLNKSDKLSYLMGIFKKHVDILKLQHVVNHFDFYNIISVANQNYSNNSAELYLSKKRIEPGNLKNVAMIQSFISYLNRNDLLKRQIAFDFTDHSGDYDSLE